MVHEHAQAAVVAVDGAQPVRRLADRAVDGVLQQLLDLLAHGSRLSRRARRSRAPAPSPRTAPASRSTPRRCAAPPRPAARPRRDRRGSAREPRRGRRRRRGRRAARSRRASRRPECRRGCRRRSRGPGTAPRGRRAAGPPSGKAGTRATPRPSPRPPAPRVSRGVHSTCSGSSATSRSARSRSEPSPDDVERRPSQLRRRAAPRLDERVERLVALEHADEDRARRLRQRRGRPLEKRLGVDVRREDGGRLDAAAPSRGRSSAWRRCARRRRGGRRAAPSASLSGLSSRRSGEPYRRVASCQSPCTSRIAFARERTSRRATRNGSRLVHALHERRLRPELAQARPRSCAAATR